MSTTTHQNPPHVALLPSSGMGHLVPFLRLAATLSAHGCIVTFITIHPTVSTAESHHLSTLFSSLPHIHSLPFYLLPHNPTATNATTTDPFFLQFEAIRHSAHLLKPLLAPLISSPTSPLSVLITDIHLASSTTTIATELGLSNYILFTSSALMLALYSHFPSSHMTDNAADEFQIPSLLPLPSSWIPPLLMNPGHLFTTLLVENSLALSKAAGIIINTFNALEEEEIVACNSGRVRQGLPPVFPIGPLVPTEFETSGGHIVAWLDQQPTWSVIYVCFGNRTALIRDQIRELGIGLERSGCRFLWIVKSKVVDKEENEHEQLFDDDGFLERVKNRGLIVRDWVGQGKILGHRAVGGFISHCGWNSVSEAAWHGVPVLAWPQLGDQKLNARVVEKSGLGIWVRRWGWAGENGEVVKGEEIEERVRELMSSASLRKGATHMRKEARRAVVDGGTSKRTLMEVLARWARE